MAETVNLTTSLYLLVLDVLLNRCSHPEYLVHSLLGEVIGKEDIVTRQYVINRWRRAINKKYITKEH